MNNDLIKRNLAIAYATSGVVRKIDGEDWIKTSEVKQNLNDVPTVDTYTIEDIQEVRENSLILGAKLAQRPQGEWIAIEPYNHKTFCPFCKKDTRDINYDNFCPNCGADMRKGGAEK